MRWLLIVVFLSGCAAHRAVEQTCDGRCTIKIDGEVGGA